MDARSDLNFVIRAKTAFQSPGLMEYFSSGGGSISATSSETVDNSSMVGSEETMAGVNRDNISSKIGEIGESFTTGLEAITVKVGATNLSSWIKIG